MVVAHTFTGYLFKTFSRIWLGVDDRTEEGKFVWDDGTTYSGWPPWKVSYPKNDNGMNCVFWDGDYWDQRNCSEKYDYLCTKTTDNGENSFNRQ